MKQFNAILRLRRDNDYNYKKVENTFIPAKGEICLIDTAQGQLKAVCGDGITTFGKLEYFNQLIFKGYYVGGLFFKDKELTEMHKAFTDVIYIDLNTNKLYYFNGEEFCQIGGSDIKTATASEAGIMKLYASAGYNEDGTMTQKAITEEIEDTEKEIKDKIDAADKILEAKIQNLIEVDNQIKNQLDEKVETTVDLNEELLIFG